MRIKCTDLQNPLLWTWCSQGHRLHPCLLTKAQELLDILLFLMSFRTCLLLELVMEIASCLLVRLLMDVSWVGKQSFSAVLARWDLRLWEQRKPSCRRVSAELSLHFQSERAVSPTISQHPALTLFTLHQHPETTSGKIHKIRLQLGKHQAPRQIFLQNCVLTGKPIYIYVYTYGLYIYI